jgi:hypothetical protein
MTITNKWHFLTSRTAQRLQKSLNLLVMVMLIAAASQQVSTGEFE